MLSVPETLGMGKRACIYRRMTLELKFQENSYVSYYVRLPYGSSAFTDGLRQKLSSVYPACVILTAYPRFDII